jgi:hypothetical protein
MTDKEIAEAKMPQDIVPGHWTFGEFVGIRQVTIAASTNAQTGEVRPAFSKYNVVLDLGEGHSVEVSYREEADARKAVEGVVPGQMVWVGQYATGSKSGKVYYNGTIGVQGGSAAQWLQLGV